MRPVVFSLVAVNALATSFLAGGNSNPAVTGCSNQPGVPVLAIPVRVMTQDLKAVEGLQASDFVITEHGVPQKVCDFGHIRQGVSVGILLDTSGSMRGPGLDLLAVARAGISRFLDISGPQDEYFLEYVSTGPAMQCMFSCDLSRIRAGLQASPKGETALVDAIYLALNAMHEAHRANQALLVVSDGLDNNSVYSYKELARAFAESPLPIFLVIPWDRWQTGPRPPEEVSRVNLMRLASRSGGYAIMVSDKKEMLAAATELASVIRSPYMLYFASSRPRSTTHVRNLRVEVKGVRPRPWVFYRAIRYAQQR